MRGSVQLPLGVVLAVLFVCFFTPVLGWMIYHYWAKRDSILISKRHPRIALFTMGLSLCSTLVVDPLWILRASKACDPLCAYMANPFYCLVNFGTALSLLLRFFIIYYELQLAHHFSTGEEEWQRIIDPRVEHKNWFVQQMAKWGSVWWITKRIAIPLVAVLSATSFITWSLHFYAKKTFDASIPAMADMAVVLLIFVVQVRYWNKLPEYQDNFKVKLEYSWILLEYGMMLAFFVMWTAILVANKGESPFWADAVVVLADGVGRLCLTYTMTWYIIGKDEVFLQKVRSASVFSQTSESTQCNLKMEKVLSHSKSLCSFMKHLCAEFCKECLLCYIEISQLLGSLRRHGHRRNNSRLRPSRMREGSEVCPEERVRFPKVVPRSQIVHNSLLDLQHRIHSLWDKYIAEGSTFEVNISGELRSRMRDLIMESNEQRIRSFQFGFGSFSSSQRREHENLQNQDSIWRHPHHIDDDTMRLVIDNFEHVLHTMWSLMESSFARFTQQEAYRIMQERPEEYFDFSD